MSLIEALDIKRKMYFEYEGAPYHCLDVEVSRPTARGGQTLVRIKMRNLLTRAVFDKTFKASDKFKEPDLEMVPASFSYSDADGFYFMDQESFETHTLRDEMIGNALDFVVYVNMDEYPGMRPRRYVSSVIEVHGLGEGRQLSRSRLFAPGSDGLAAPTAVRPSERRTVELQRAGFDMRLLLTPEAPGFWSVGFSRDHRADSTASRAQKPNRNRGME
jgi:translation elongation factor P/translation initiation factor 5A